MRIELHRLRWKEKEIQELQCRGWKAKELGIWVLQKAFSKPLLWVRPWAGHWIVTQMKQRLCPCWTYIFVRGWWQSCRHKCDWCYDRGCTGAIGVQRRNLSSSRVGGTKGGLDKWAAFNLNLQNNDECLCAQWYMQRVSFAPHISPILSQ